MISKLRAIAKIESEVDSLVLTPVNQQILSLNPAEPLPATLDTYYVRGIPRNVLVLENDLTQKLLSLDEIGGASEIVRSARKGLISKIEKILSRVDAIKRIYATMTPPPNPTPTISSVYHDASTPSSSSSTMPETEEALLVNKKKESESTPLYIPANEDESSQSFADGMSSMDIQDVSEPSSSSAPPVISYSSSTIPPTWSSSSQVPSLKQMCYSMCDSLIKKGLVV